MHKSFGVLHCMLSDGDGARERPNYVLSLQPQHNSLYLAFFTFLQFRLTMSLSRQKSGTEILNEQILTLITIIIRFISRLSSCRFWGSDKSSDKPFWCVIASVFCEAIPSSRRLPRRKKSTCGSQ